MASITIIVDVPPVICSTTGCTTPESAYVTDLVECSGPDEARVSIARNLRLPSGWTAVNISDRSVLLCQACQNTLMATLNG